VTVGVILDALTLTLGDLEFDSIEFLQISLSIGLVVFVSRHEEILSEDARDEAAVVVYTHLEFECGDLFIVGTDLNILLADDVSAVAAILAEMQKFSSQAVSRHADER